MRRTAGAASILVLSCVFLPACLSDTEESEDLGAVRTAAVVSDLTDDQSDVSIEADPDAPAHDQGRRGNWDQCNFWCMQENPGSDRHWRDMNGNLVCSYSIFNGCNSGIGGWSCPNGYGDCFKACIGGQGEAGTTTMGCHPYWCGSGGAGQQGTCGGPSGQYNSRCGGAGTLTYQGWGSATACATEKGLNTNASCYCDSLCAQYNDCCPDAGECSGTTSHCERDGACGGYNANGRRQSDTNVTGCYCDFACVQYGDCCVGGPCG